MDTIMKRFIIIAIVLLGCIDLVAAKTEFLTPYQCMDNIKKNIIENDNPKEAVKSMHFPEDFKYSKIVSAEQMGKILIAQAVIINLDMIPKSPTHFDSTEQKNVYYPFTGEKWFFLEKVGNQWLVSKKSVDEIHLLYNQIFFININSLEKEMPTFLMHKILGLKIWQWIGVILYLMLSVLLYYILNKILVSILEKLVSKYAKLEVFDRYLLPIAKPLSLFLIFSGLLIVISILQLPTNIAGMITYVIKFIMPLLIVIIAYRLTDVLRAILLKLAAKTENTVDDQIIPLIIKIIKVAVIIIGSIYIVSNMGWNIAPLLAGASIGGLAFALAAQDTIKNLFGSFTMFTDQPFEVGDWIVFSGGEGTVEEIGIRSTRVRTFYNSLISVPNGTLANAIIDNMGRREFRRYVTTIGLTYDTTPEGVDAFVEGLRGIVDNHPKTRKDYYQIHLKNFGASAIEIMFYIFFEAKDWTEELEARHQVLSEIMRLAVSLDIRFAYNTQTLHIENTPGFESLTPNTNFSQEEYTQKRNEFMKRYNKK
jgi:MscS family membrane protein